MIRFAAPMAALAAALILATPASAAVTENGLLANALTENALHVNALTENALTQNALTENALHVNALDRNSALAATARHAPAGLVGITLASGVTLAR